MTPRNPPHSSVAVALVPWPRRRPDRFGRWLTAVALLGVLAACASGSASASPTVGPGSSAVPRAAPFPSAAPNSLEGSITAALEGAQLETPQGATPSPDGYTSVLFHHGTWAAEAAWTAGGWCLARVYTWRVADAVDAAHFTLDYRVTQEYTNCVPHWGSERRVVITADEAIDGSVTYSASDERPGGRSTVRTVCSRRWNDPSPCGFTDAAAERPSPDA